MKKTILALFAGCLLVAACHKENGNSGLPVPENGQTNLSKDGGDDDDFPIIMEVTLDTNGDPIDNSTVTFCSNQDTLTGTTGQDGSYTVKLPFSGVWYMYIVRNGYQPLEAHFQISDSFSVRTDTLR
jgi:hypothetical protein